MSGSTISSAIGSEVLLGSGVYPSPLSITGKGAIDNAAGYGILASDIANATVINSGAVIGGTDGIYLYQSSATLVNQSYISGRSAAVKVSNFSSGEVLVENSGTLTGGTGILGMAANVTNSGFIYGSKTGIDLQISTILNTGTITGQDGVYSRDGTLTNQTAIRGNAVGIYISGGYALNAGSISGSLGTGARVEDELGGGGVTVPGSLVNDGTISGGIYGVYAGSGTFTNDGKATGRIGLAVGMGGSASNATTGVLNGSAYGAALIGRAIVSAGASLSNAGSIIGGEIGVTLGIHANLLNSGYIYGPNYGVAIYSGYLTNSGRIVNADVGVTLAGGVVVNNATINAATLGVTLSSGLITNYGTIYGKTSGAVVGGGSLANFHDISGGTYGVSVSEGNVTNYGVISSPVYGMTVARGTVTNGGTISGGVDAITGSFITLVVDPGAVFDGQVNNANGKSLLALAGAGIGALDGIGAQITGFKEISFATGPEWSIEGNESGLASNAATIVGFAKGDTIVLDGFSASSDSYVKATGLELVQGTNTVTLDISGNFSTGSFKVTGSGDETTIVNVTCFAKGTRIATPDGEAAVEALNIGDPVRTLYGGVQPVKWIGRHSYDGRFLRGNKAVLPVRIQAGAIADGVPARDLFVSPGHAISVDDMLIHAARLANGVTIQQLQAVESITYFHVELENHEIIFAEACPAETFMGENFRRQFQNFEEFYRLYPGQDAPSVMCQPRLDSGFLLHSIQRRLRARAGLQEIRDIGALRGYVDQAGPSVCFGWAQNAAVPGQPVSLDIFCNDRRIGRVLANLYRQDVAKAGYGDGYQGFEFRIPTEIAGPIEVRRSADGALLEMAANTLHTDAVVAAERAA